MLLKFSTQNRTLTPAYLYLKVYHVMLRQLQIYYVSVSSYNTISDPFVVRGKFIATARLGHSCYMLIKKINQSYVSYHHHHLYLNQTTRSIEYTIKIK